MSLPETKAELRELVIQLVTTNQQLVTENQALTNRIEELEKLLKRDQIKSPPHVKPSTKPKKSKTRNPRTKAYVRKRSSKPDQMVFHAHESCPDCHVPLSGKSIAYTREIIDVPMSPVLVTHHVVLKRRCWQCNHVWTPNVDFSSAVVGQSRWGHNVVSLVTYLTEWLRLPLGKVQEYLQETYGLDISVGSLVEIRHRVAHQGASHHRQLQSQLRKSPVLHADETSHRENGVNKYTWTFSTAKIRYFLYQRGRGKEVIREVLGEEFEGVLCSDFYASYNTYDGMHQRCWAHLLRDIKDECRIYDDDDQLKQLKNQIQRLYERGLAVQTSHLSLADRHVQRQELENQLLEVVLPYTQDKSHPFHILAKRIDRYVDELFVFVLDTEIDSTNNAAERSLRHNVISRKISGGTRSASGSRTKEILASLFGTWHVRGLSPLQECRALISNPAYVIPHSS